MNMQKLAEVLALVLLLLLCKKKGRFYDNAIDSPQHFRYEP